MGLGRHERKNSGFNRSGEAMIVGGGGDKQ